MQFTCTITKSRKQKIYIFNGDAQKKQRKKMREAYPKKVYCKGVHTEIVFFLLKENNDLHINLQKCACIHRTIRFEMPVMESQKPNLHPFPKSFRMNLTHIV